MSSFLGVTNEGYLHCFWHHTRGSGHEDYVFGLFQLGFWGICHFIWESLLFSR